MPTHAKVTSVEALESFRNALIIYLSKARPTLEEVSSDFLRHRTWLETEQRLHWQNQVRSRTKKLDEAQTALFSAEISNLREATVAERMSVNKAKRSLQEAEDKLRMVKKWNREFDSRAAPLAKQLGKLQTILTTDVPHAIAYLTQTVKTLHDYAEINIGDSRRPENPSLETERRETNEPDSGCVGVGDQPQRAGKFEDAAADAPTPHTVAVQRVSQQEKS